MQEKRRTLISRLVFRLVKKHIAGQTSGSVLNAVRELNEKGLHTTVTLLNDHVDEPVKARYNTNAYVQLIKQVSRLHLNTGISLRLTQIGYNLGDELLEKNIGDIVDAAESDRVKLWIENEQSVDTVKLLEIYRQYKARHADLGVEVLPEHIGSQGFASQKGMIKVRFYTPSKMEKEGEEERKKKMSKKEFIKLYKSNIDKLVSQKASVTLLEHDSKLINKLVKMDRDYKKDLVFEIPLGYSNRKMKKMIKNKLNVSVYVPYGKDWVPYFINRLAEGRVRNIAIKLLKNTANGDMYGTDAEQEL